MEIPSVWVVYPGEAHEVGVVYPRISDRGVVYPSGSSKKRGLLTLGIPWKSRHYGLLTQEKHMRSGWFTPEFLKEGLLTPVILQKKKVVYPGSSLRSLSVRGIFLESSV